MTNTEECIRLTRHRDDFHVLMGRDTTIFAGLNYGCTGAITSCGNIAPRVAVDIYENYLQGDMEGALEAQFRLSRLRIATNIGTFPVVIKEGLRMIGQEAGDCQPPLLPLNKTQQDMLHSVLEEINLLKPIIAGEAG